MTERKVLNKYFPPEYDPSKIPRKPKGHNNRVFNIRTMAPCNMRCDVCRVYIYKARKFNSRVSVAEGITYLGLRQYRFKIRCPSCCNEIVWRSDIESNDYVLESGATRNFEALRTAEKLEAEQEAAREEELANNPMKALEERTSQSRNEMEILEALADIQEMKKSEAGMEMSEKLIAMHATTGELDRLREEADEEALIQSLINEQQKRRQLEDSDSDDEAAGSKPSVVPPVALPKKQALLEKIRQKQSAGSSSWAGLVKRKDAPNQPQQPPDKRNQSSSDEPETKKVKVDSLLVEYSESDSSTE